MSMIIDEAIKQLKEGGETIESISKAIELLESEPEPTEFTKKWRNKAENILVLAHVKQQGNREEDKDVGKSWTMLASVILEACSIIDRLTAENKQLRGEEPIPYAWWKDCPKMAQRTMERIIAENKELKDKNEELITKQHD